jgi:WW domain-binding protein 4
LTSASTPSSRKPNPNSSDPYANYSTAASLGYTDPDAERLKAEVERRRTQGVVGDWEVVTESSSTPDQDSTVGVKREWEEELDPSSQPWKLRSKATKIGLDEIYDPGIIPIRLKTEKEQGIPQIEAEKNGESGPLVSKTEDPPVKPEETETLPFKSLFRKRKTPFTKKS